MKKIKVLIIVALIGLLLLPSISMAASLDVETPWKIVTGFILDRSKHLWFFTETGRLLEVKDYYGYMLPDQTSPTTSPFMSRLLQVILLIIGQDFTSFNRGYLVLRKRSNKYKY